jgi:trimethylamine:corrinoid methyltransferase-like protein
MEMIQFGLSGGLSSQQIAMIHDAVLAILEDTGLACGHAPTVAAVTASEGVRFEGGRLRFSPDLVEATIERARAAGRRGTPAERVSVGAPWNCFNIIDLDTDEIRASTAADAVSALKLVASFTRGGPAPVYPCDLDQRIQVLWTEKLCLELAPEFGGGLAIHDPESIRWARDLYAAAGEKYHAGYQFVISPLRLDHVALDLYWRFRDDPLVHISMDLCPIPVGGLTAPLFTSGLLAQGLAESLGALIVAQRLGSSGPDDLLPVRADYGDMRDLTVAYSLPQSVMVQVLLRDLAEHFSGYRHDTIYINTNAKRADALATLDRMAYMLMLGLAGYRNFILGAGQLSMDEIFSPAQFMIDLEIGRYVQAVLDGISWSGDARSIAQAVAEGVAEGSFLAHPTTVEALPEFLQSSLFRRSNVGQWRAAGQRTIEQEAVAKAKAAIASFHRELAPEKQRDLDRVFADACRALGVDLASQPIAATRPASAPEAP